MEADQRDYNQQNNESQKDKNKNPNSLSQPKPKVPTQQQEKTSLTSYSFARNKEEPNSGDSVTTPPPSNQSKTPPNYIPVPPHMAQVPPSQFNQIPPQMMMNYTSPSPTYPPMYPPQMKGAKPVIQSNSPNHPMIPFQDMQYMQDGSGNNTPMGQVDPSPTAETLIPVFLQDEIDHKLVATSQIRNAQDQSKSRLLFHYNSTKI